MLYIAHPIEGGGGGGGWKFGLFYPLRWLLVHFNNDSDETVKWYIGEALNVDTKQPQNLDID